MALVITFVSINRSEYISLSSFVTFVLLKFVHCIFLTVSCCIFLSHEHVQWCQQLNIDLPLMLFMNNRYLTLTQKEML